MKNIKFLTLTVFMFLAVNISQTFAQDEIGSVTPDVDPCPFTVSGELVQGITGRVAVTVSTGLNLLIPLNLNNPSFSAPISISPFPYPINTPNFPTTIMVADIRSRNTEVFVDGVLVCSPGQVRRVYFNVLGCTFSF